MRTLVLLIVILGLAVLPAPAQTYYLTPDVPTDLLGTTYLPWEIVRHDSGSYSSAFTFPQHTFVDSIHHMCSGRWLFSPGAAVELPPGGGAWFEPWDLGQTDGTVYTMFLCGGLLGFPPGTNIDAAFMRGGDLQDVVVSFDAVTDLTGIGGGIYEPADLVQLTPTGPACQDWAIAGTFFDASGATPPVPLYANVTGSDAGRYIDLGFDVPTTLSVPTYFPGQVVGWDASLPGFLLDHAPPWPLNRSSRMNGFSYPPGPGEVPSMHAQKSTTTTGNVLVTWVPSLSAGAEDYAVYGGNLGTWYSHTPVTCTDTGSDLQEDFTPATGDRYYLVVALNPNAEGSYGRQSWPPGFERPQLAGSCRSWQDLACP